MWFHTEEVSLRLIVQVLNLSAADQSIPGRRSLPAAAGAERHLEPRAERSRRRRRLADLTEALGAADPVCSAACLEKQVVRV